eukprot:m.21405 g.21405  ORF g.21405 m.21405 type:complete len:596 (-) comp7135_c0_seq2:255-2042(-)
MMESLPTEVVHHILNFTNLNTITRVAQVSKRFHGIVASYNGWRDYAMKLWPSLCFAHGFDNDLSVNWLERCKRRKLIGNLALYALEHKCYTAMIHATTIMDYQVVNGLEAACEDIAERKIDTLTRPYIQENLANMSLDDLCYLFDAFLDISKDDNDRCHGYYGDVARKAMARYIITKTTIWTELLIEDGALMIECWMRGITKPMLQFDLKQFLDDVADRINKKHLILERQELHSPLEQLKLLCTGMREEGFTGEVPNYYSVKNSYLSELAKSRKGIPITLSIVLIAVGRRLGMDLVPINSPGHFVCALRISDTELVYVDAFQSFTIIGTKEQAKAYMNGIWSSDEALVPVHAVAVFARVVGNFGFTPIFRDRTMRMIAVDLFVSLKGDKRYRTDLFEKFGIENEHLELYRSDLESIGAVNIEQRLQMFLRRSNFPQKGVKRLRSAILPQNAPFIGAVCYHMKYQYYCVIAGWDPECLGSSSWRMHMQVTADMAKEPFFQVLAADQTNRYVALRNLRLVEPGEVKGRLFAAINTHKDISKYFPKIHGNGELYRAELNQALARQYPEDAELAKSYIPCTPTSLCTLCRQSELAWTLV